MHMHGRSNYDGMPATMPARPAALVHCSACSTAVAPQICPPGSGFEQECFTTRTCVRHGTPCPNLVDDVPLTCPTPATLMGEWGGEQCHHCPAWHQQGPC